MVATPQQNDTPHTFDALQRIHELEQENSELRQELRWIDQLFAVPASTASPSHKATLRAVTKHLREHKADVGEFVQIKSWELCETVGQSKDTFLSNLTYCTDKLKVLQKHRKRIEYGEGEYTTELYVSATELLGYPRLYSAPAARNHGGERKKCVNCGSENLDTYALYHCRDCGYDHFEPKDVAKIGATSLKWQDDVSEDSAPISESQRWQDDVSRDAPTNGNLTFCITTEEKWQLDVSEEPAASTHVPSAALELQSLPIWACHRAKVPYNAKPEANNAKAKSNDPGTWASYDQVQATYEASQSWKLPYDGIGFMCNGDFTVIDQDHCRDNDTGQVSDQAQVNIAVVDSYTEISYSETGLHTIARGSIPRNVKRAGIEMYDHDRFIVWTGKHLVGTPVTIEERQEQLDALFSEVVPPKEERQPRPCVYVPRQCSDAEIVEKARNAASGAKFRDLYDTGNIAGYPSQSEADLALCGMLAYWTDNDACAMDRLFRQSRLYREKWDRSVGKDETYGERTIGRVLSVQERRAS